MAAVATVAYIATAPGQTFVVSLLNTPLTEELGVEPLELNAAYTAATVAAALPLVLIGRLTDAVGPRRSLAIVAAAFGLGCVVMAGASGLVSLCLGFFALRFLGQGALALVSQHTVAMWFHDRLGSVLGIKQVVVFGVWIGAPPLAMLLIHELGWRSTYMVFGGLAVATVVPLALALVRDRPEDLGLAMDGRPPDGLDSSSTTSQAPARATVPVADFALRDAARTSAYWVLAAVCFLSPLIGTALLFDMQPIVAARGLSPASAAIAVSALTATMAVMAVPSGYVADRVRPAIVLATGMGGIALAVMLVHRSDSLAAVVVAMVSLGTGQALATASAGATIARFFGREHHGAIRGSISRIGVIGTGLGPICTGLSIHLTGTYGAAMFGFAAACVPVLLASATLSSPKLSIVGHGSTT